MNFPLRPTLLKPLLALIAFCALNQRADAADLTLSNAEGTLRFSLQVQNGNASYQIDALNGALQTPVIEDSPLGITRTDANFTTGLSLVAATAPKIVSDDYTLVVGKFHHLRSRGLERTFTFRNALNMRLTLAVRAYRDGIAFRYGMPGQSSQLYRISDEATGFNVPDTGRIWSQSHSKVDKWAPGYESEGVNGAPIGTTAPGPEGWSMPLLFQANNLWGLVTESGLDSSFFASHFQPDAPNGLYRPPFSPIRAPAIRVCSLISPPTRTNWRFWWCFSAAFNTSSTPPPACCRSPLTSRDI